KDELLQELARVQGKQRDVATQLEGAEDQLKRLEGAAKAVEQRRSQLAFSEKRIAAFEARAAELSQLAEEMEAKITALTRREEVVEAVRKEVAGVHEISARSKADLQYVEGTRNHTTSLREKVDEVLACVGETETRLAHIESRKKLIDEGQLKTSVIPIVLEDVHRNLETLGEQKAVVDHVMENVSHLTHRLQEAQTTLRAL